MFSRCYSILMILIACQLLWAQPLVLNGRVLNAETADPLEGANVVSEGTGTTTDEEGRFQLTITPGDSITISFIGYETIVLRPVERDVIVRLQPVVLEMKEIVVTGGLREQALNEVPASVTVINRHQLQAAGNHHLQNLIQAVPNLSWAGGTSRPRYFQIRGIGERSHYAGEGPPNFSVGFMLDDVDLSGLGMAGVTFDLDQMEVFKGPQSMIFGPNAMAGLINLQSANPTQVLTGNASATSGNDELFHFAGVVNVPLNKHLAVRAGYHTARSNGFRGNRFLNIDDSNRRQESLARAKVRYAASNGLTLLGTFFRADINNGYDAWTPDNNEGLVTYSDNPGKDRQLTNAFSLRAAWPLKPIGAELMSISAYSQVELEHSFDGDWGNDDFWRQAPYNFDPEEQGWRYDFFDRILRERTTFTQELRLLKSGVGGKNGNLVLGAYWKTSEETDNANGYLFGGDATDLNSVFDIEDLAVYGQYGRNLSGNLRLSLNLRLDRNAITYAGATNGGAENVDFDVAQWLVGGKLAMTYQLAANRGIYGAVSRGYRAGGINQHPYLAALNRPYDPEYIVNMEAGFRSSGEKGRTSLTFFHALRTDQQVNLSSQQNPGDPNSFFFFIANASRGRNSGIELEQNYRLKPDLNLFGSLGYLNTHVDAYTFETASGEAVTLGDRAAAHAPAYTLRIGGEYRNRKGFFGRLELTATDEFFFSDSHDQISGAYQVLNGSIGYRAKYWKLTLWGKNLLDERYAVRGFFFGLEPPDFTDRLYVSHGDPRQFGLSLSATF